MVKIMHMADIHLDSPFTLENPEKSAERRQELRDTFLRAIEYAKEEEINLLLLPGDLLEYEHLSPDTADLIRDAFASIPQTQVVIAPGNHDYYTDTCIYKKVNFTDNVHIFKKPDVSKFSFDEYGVDVYGYAFNSRYFDRHPLSGFRPESSERINILCAHMDLGTSSRSCPVPLSDLAATGVDYAALGHVHNGGEIKKTGDVTYAYSGSIEGRDYGEVGYKGAIVGSIDKALGRPTVNLSFRRFSKRRYIVEWVNVTGATEGETVIEKLKNQISDYGEDTHLRVILHGDISPEISIKSLNLEEIFTRPYILNIVDKTMPLFNYDSLRDDPTIRGAFFRQLLPDLQSEDPVRREVAAAALRYGLDALSNRDII